MAINFTRVTKDPMQDKDALIFSTELLHTFTILAINTGSTSTKMAVYRNRTPVVELCVTHRTDEIERFETLTDQVEWRKGIILSTLADNDIDPTSFSAVIGRGGLLRPIESGVYEVNELMIDELRHCTPQHASNLSAIIADEIAQQCGVKAYIADPVVVDERIDVAKMCGVAQIRRRSVFHALNQKATARIYAERVGRRWRRTARGASSTLTTPSTVRVPSHRNVQGLYLRAIWSTSATRDDTRTNRRGISSSDMLVWYRSRGPTPYASLTTAPQPATARRQRLSNL